MTERGWLIRDLARRVLADSPPPPATWSSVVRRVAVIAVFFILGIARGDLSMAVLACFGALQVGLVEAALPFRRFAWLLVRIALASMVAVGLAMWLGGSWWAVVLLAALAYVFGCTAALSPRAFAIGVSALALGVIFAGNPRPLDQIPVSLGWLALGMAAQLAAALVMWQPERIWFARRALANKMRADEAILRRRTVEPSALIRAHTLGDSVDELIDGAGFREDDESRLRGALASVRLATRAVVAWMVLEEPGELDRMRVGIRVSDQAKRLESAWRRPVIGSPRVGDGAPDLDGVDRRLDEVDDAIDALNGRGTGRAAAARQLAAPDRVRVLHALLPGGGRSRHGLRMALGVGTAEVLTLVLPGSHSFWLPLTVVFVLRPDWSFTVARGLNRLVGNIAAVLVVPAAITMLGGSTWSLFGLLLAVSTVLYRYFFGHYAIASFGLAGTVLLLDYSTSASDQLFTERLTDTLLGALLSVAVVLVVPGWSRATAPLQVEALSGAIERWRVHVRLRAQSPGSQDEGTLEADVAEARRALRRLEPTVTGVLLEPSRSGRPVELAMVLSAGSRECSALMAATYSLLGERGGIGDRDEAQRARLVERAGVDRAAVEFDEALARYRA